MLFLYFLRFFTIFVFNGTANQKASGQIAAVQSVFQRWQPEARGGTFDTFNNGEDRSGAGSLAQQ